MDLIRFVFTLSPRQEGHGILPHPSHADRKQQRGKGKKWVVLIKSSWFGVRYAKSFTSHVHHLSNMDGEKLICLKGECAKRLTSKCDISCRDWKGRSATKKVSTAILTNTAMLSERILQIYMHPDPKPTGLQLIKTKVRCSDSFIESRWIRGR